MITAADVGKVEILVSELNDYALTKKGASLNIIVYLYLFSPSINCLDGSLLYIWFLLYQGWRIYYSLTSALVGEWFAETERDSYHMYTMMCCVTKIIWYNLTCAELWSDWEMIWVLIKAKTTITDLEAEWLVEKNSLIFSDRQLTDWHLVKRKIKT